jgi:ariadne-1
MQKIKENSGISQTKASQEKLDKYFKKNKIPNNICLVCETEIEPGDCISLECNHQFCFDCFKEYLKEKTNDQLTLLATKCPMQFCNFQVPSEIFLKVLKDDKEKLNIYNKCLMRNFTESNADIKLCPNPKCDIIVKLPGHGMIEVKCHCGMTFCFKCLRDGHRPCDCEMIDFWEAKNKSDGENTKWLIVNTKQCPNCHKYIEKNQGCNHMTCRKEAGGCGYEFCWICLGEWKPHGSSWYECKKYNPTELDKRKEEMRLNTKYELERYANFYDSYSNEVKALKFGIKLKDTVEKYKLALEKDKEQPHLELKFLDEALQTVLDCHNILKNTYIFGYYMNNNLKEYQLYVYHQEMLRRQGDLLYDQLETDYLPKIIKKDNLEEFNKSFAEYKGNIKSLMSTISTFKENVLNEIENHPDYIDYSLLKNVSTSASQSKKK